MDRGDKDDEPRSLKAIFAEAETKRLALESARLAPNSTEYADTVSSAIELYQDVLRLVSAAALFSPNESAEDLTTQNLPYLLADYHLAELTQRLPYAGPDARRRTLAAAREAYERYLHLLDGYGLLSDPHRRLLERYADAPAAFSTLPPDPFARREAKIANSRAERELRARLEYLRRRPRYGAGEDGDGDDGDGREEGRDGAGGRGGGGGGAGPEGDEDLVRETHLAHLHYAAHMAFQALEMLNRELEVLAQAPPEGDTIKTPQQQERGREEDDARRRQREGPGGGYYSDRLDQPLRSGPGLGAGGPLLSTGGKPLRPFTLVNSRQELARGVFRPGHNLPTMTIDEYLAEERRRGGIIEGGGEASLRREEPDEDDMEKADAETMKARAWDEFVEANPRGSGNTLNRG